MTISIIIPSLNEGAYIQKTLEHLHSLPGNFEIIVADGGSTDNTVKLVQEFNSVKLITSQKGRGKQMNKGATVATGDILLFLHADTFLPDDAYTDITGYMRQNKNIGGSFYLKFDKKHLLLNCYSWCSRHNLEFFTYGDHAFFIRTKVFEEIGGYKEIPFMEDIEIQKRLRKAGRFKKLKTGVVTSARRFQKTGTLKQLAMNILLVFAFNLGVPPAKLKQFYKDHG